MKKMTSLGVEHFLMSYSKGVGGEYPASSTSASEAANEKMIENRGPGRRAYHTFIAPRGF